MTCDVSNEIQDRGEDTNLDTENPPGIAKAELSPLPVSLEVWDNDPGSRPAFLGAAELPSYLISDLLTDNVLTNDDIHAGGNSRENASVLARTALRRPHYLTLGVCRPREAAVGAALQAGAMVDPRESSATLIVSLEKISSKRETIAGKDNQSDAVNGRAGEKYGEGPPTSQRVGESIDKGSGKKGPKRGVDQVSLDGVDDVVCATWSLTINSIPERGLSLGIVELMPCRRS